MEIAEFEWDENNIDHIAKHRVYPDEIENVAFDDEPWIKRVGWEPDTVRIYRGWKIPFCFYVLRSKGIARVITAMDMDEKRGK